MFTVITVRINGAQDTATVNSFSSAMRVIGENTSGLGDLLQGFVMVDSTLRSVRFNRTGLIDDAAEKVLWNKWFTDAAAAAGNNLPAARTVSTNLMRKR